MMTGEHYLKAIEHLGMTQAGSARFFGVTPKTPHNWVAGTHAIPDSVSMLLCLMTLCELAPEDVLEVCHQWVAQA